MALTLLSSAFFWTAFALWGPLMAAGTMALTFAALGIGYEWSRFAAEAEDHG